MRTIPVDIITGFLGAGKTTLLNQILHDEAFANAAVIVNEFGEVGLDHLLIEQADDDIIELSSGCLCCAMRGALVDTLASLVERAGKTLTRIIIETTGLADPEPVIQTILQHPRLSGHIRLGSILCVVDSFHTLTTLKQNPEAKKQISFADRIYLSKTDQAPASEELYKALSNLNQSAEYTNENVEPAALFALPKFKPFKTHHFECIESEGHKAITHSEATSFCLERTAPLTQTALYGFLDLLAGYYAPSLLRVKGLVYIQEHPEEPMLIQGVRHIFQQPQPLRKWHNKPQTTRLTFITTGLIQEKIETLYDSFSNTIRPDTPDQTALMHNPLALGQGFKFSE